MKRATLILLPLVLLVGCKPAAEVQKSEVKASCGLPVAKQGGWVKIPAGSVVLGQDPAFPEEGPTMRVQVAGFEMQAHEVTNREFAAFVAAKAYVTDAEKSLSRTDG
ncbi:MAG: hypothetical protein RL145_146, partial [Pseudomonadota bacterium]